MRKADKMKVKLQEVLEALEGAGMEIEYYYDTKTQEILMVFDGMISVAMCSAQKSIKSSILS